MNFQRHILDDADYPRLRPLLPGLSHREPRCFGGSASSSSNQSKQQTLNTSGATSPVTGDSSPQNNQGQQYVTQKGSLAVTNNTTADPVVTGQAFDAIQSLVGQALSSQNTTAAQTNQSILDANGSNQNALNSVLANVLSRDQGIASNTATGGASGQQSFILWMVGIVVAGLFIVPKLIGKIPRKAKA